MKLTWRQQYRSQVAATRIALVGLACVCFLPTVLAGEPDPQELRERADVLERRAQALKAEGEHDKAQAVQQKAEELRAETRGLGRPERDRPSADRRQEIQRQHERALAEIRELRAAGKEEQAMELKRHIQEMEEQLARLERQERTQPRPERERLARRPQGLERESVAPDPQQRMMHIQVAIDNLHAAGLHDVADRLTQQTQAPQPRDFGGRARFQGRGPQAMPRAELEQLRDEVQELRQAVRELRARLEQGARR